MPGGRVGRGGESRRTLGAHHGRGRPTSRAKDLQATARQSHFRLPRATAAGLSGVGGRVPSPTTGSTGWRSRGGSRAIPATAALATVRGEPVGAWALRVRSQSAPTGRWPAGPWRSRTTWPSPGAPTRNGPVLLDSYVPDEDATVVERVLDAGAIILGKAGLREPVLLWAANATPPAGLRAHGCRR